MTQTTVPELEVVVTVTEWSEALEPRIHALHAHLEAMAREPWQLTLVDHASVDEAGGHLTPLAEDLPGVKAVHLPERLGRRQLRERWASSPATVVAFVALRPGVDLVARVEPLLQHRQPVAITPPPASATGVSRRRALAAIGGVGATVLLAACGRGSSSSSATTAASATASTTAGTNAGTTNTTGATTTAATSGEAVQLIPEMTEGPYYLDLDLVRGDIVEDRVGAPLALELAVVDPGGAAIEGAAVDIWHCDAEGIYSGFVAASTRSGGGSGGPPGGGGPGGARGGGGGSTSTDETTFLRGTQVSRADGRVRFSTLYPGWYSGRTVHIHMKVHVGDTTHTTQLFFDDTFTDELYASTEPYSSQGERDVRNDDDNIFSGGGDRTTLAVTPSGSGYTASMVLGVSQ